MKTGIHYALCGAALIVLSCAIVPVNAAAQAVASMDEISITSHGSRMNGLIYLAGGAGPHPVVIFLHGFPGNERNLDLAQAVRRAGYQALYFDYRGNWGSGGAFSFANGREDVAAALAWVRSPANAAKYSLDPNRITLVGHSFGGWLALLSARTEPARVCVAALAPWNIGWDGSRFASHPDERASNLSYFRDVTGDGGPIRARPEDLLGEMTADTAASDFLNDVGRMKAHAFLLAGATRDTPDENSSMTAQLAKELRAAGATKVRSIAYDDDHPFSSHRLTLAGALVGWLKTDCAGTQR